MDLKTIEDEALSMSPEDRAKFAQKLILSLDLLTKEEIQELRLIEAERRV